MTGNLCLTLSLYNFECTLSQLDFRGGKSAFADQIEMARMPVSVTVVPKRRVL